uniref:Dynamin-like GTPase OPA1, mitochondrial n=1 Tax=Meloidogyne incognita TaxID=6306 RepID=A0A914LX08_MELIC
MAALIRHALKLRYWLIGGAAAGGITTANWIDDLKKSLPDFPAWAKYEHIASTFDKFSPKFKGLNFRQELERLWQLNEHKGEGVSIDSTSGANERMDSSFEASTQHEVPGSDSGGGGGSSLLSRIKSKFSKAEVIDAEEDAKMSEMTETERIQKLQEDLLKTQLQYQRELELLEKENKVLKQRILLKDAGELKRQKKIKRSLIELYSDMLDILIEYDSSYGTADNLPRVVVVGDQSAGKTSVLEMIAQARIFPRGSGEMMTRAPVKVTLSEGPYHIAQFRDSNREFDLTNPSDLQQLRNEIELRMLNSVEGGRTVSNEVISLTVKGPSLPRMVLVDLPGVISTVTTDMASGTKEDIFTMCKQHMENPNAIILCIQDGSVDAERSNVTDLVSSIDPTGQRTILVLTKVDLAEKNLNNPNRIKKILEGKLFPMKALGYFAVVTGTGTKESSIGDIRSYEEEFFANSKLFRDGILKATQMTTRNMSMAVADCFWRMVRESIEAQADAFRASRFNLETEWRNTFTHQRDLTRDELFEKARGEVLDEIVTLSLVSATEWEQLLRTNLWNAIAHQVFDQILMPASAVDNAGSFNTLIDIKLKHWAEKELAHKSVQVGWETLSQIFRRQVEKGSGTISSHTAKKQQRDHKKSGELLTSLKNALVETALSQHKWEPKALDYLRVIQLNSVADQVVPDRRAWEQSCEFMQKACSDRLEELKKTLDSARGPSGISGWISWSSPTPEQQINKAIQDELFSILSANPDHKQSLLDDDLTVVRRNLDAKNVLTAEVTQEQIRQQWRLVFRQHFLEKLLQASRDCLSFYQNYKQGIRLDSDLDCQAVVFFYRINRMLELSCNALRQQVVNTEQKRLEKEVKEILNDWSQDNEKKKQYLTGRQVELAEELAQVRFIQEKLEEFIIQLHQEKP